jgi:hypothetical protein
MATAQATTASQRFGGRILIIAVADSLALIPTTIIDHLL